MDNDAQIWAEEELFFVKEEYFSCMIQAIDAAKESIFLESYIFHDDPIGEKVLQALEAAAARGLDVRMTIDGVGSFHSAGKIFHRLKKNKVKLKIYHPVPFFQFSFWLWFRLDLVLRAFAQINKRLHRKICVIDGKGAFLGSMNVSAIHARDTGARFVGAAVDTLSFAFLDLWQRTVFRKKSSFQSSLLRINNTRKLRRVYRHDLSRKMRAAKKSILITNAYFVPPLSLVNDICDAALRGVDVELIVPLRSDHFFIDWIVNAYYKILLQHGVRVYGYKKEFLHAKTIIIDSWCLVGSSNMNHRSAFHDLEVDVVLSHDSSVSDLREEFKADLLCSDPIQKEDLDHTSLKARFLHWFINFFRYWL